MDRKLMSGGLQLARNMTPRDTGNLAFNSLTATPTQTGFKLTYRYRLANYVHYLNEGTRYSDKHKGFVERIARQVGGYMASENAGVSNNLAVDTAHWKNHQNNQESDRRVNTMMRSIHNTVSEDVFNRRQLR